MGKKKDLALHEDGRCRPCTLALQLGLGCTELIIPGRHEPEREVLVQLAFRELSYLQEPERKHCTLFHGTVRKTGGGLEMQREIPRFKI